MNFEKLTPEDYPGLKKYFANQKYPLCAYSLSSIIAWSTEFFQPYGAVVDNALIVGAEYTRHKDRRHLILPVGNGREYNPEMLARLAERTGFGQYFFVPEQYIARYGKDRIESLFQMQEQTAFEDYVYETRDLADLEGNKYSKKRNLINQFKKEYMSRQTVEIEPITANDARECIGFLEKWCAERACDRESAEDMYCEKKAAINTIENIETLEVNGLMLRMDGEICAFGMGARLTADMGLLQFEKAFSAIKGLYQYFDQQCAQRLFKDFAYINKESDMDLPGLEKAKKSYHPAMTIKSFRLALR